MIIIGGSTGRLSSTLLVTLLLGGCYYSSHINPDAAQRTNASFERNEGGANLNPDYPHDAVIRLWSDKPEYAVLVNAKHVKEMRVISTVSPDYPYWLHLAHVEANVLVSFVVGIDGKVEDARIIESSDSRFNSSAIEAIRKFTWIAAEGAAGPEREMAIVPFYFRAPKKGT
jgi:TonB family protein